ncbi:MAG: CHAT domain-containing protein [Phormidesmis sp.]
MEKRLQQSIVLVAKPLWFPVTWIVGFVAALFPTSQKPVQAQVVSTADGAGTTVTTAGDQYDIAGGTQAGGNLFHEFDEFSLEQTQTANFMSDSGVFNIVGQVSEANPSYIDGTVQVTGSDANLYLVNPSGVLFGPNAQLSLQGSFTATTADQVGFGEEWLDVSDSDSDYTALTADLSAYRFTDDEASGVVNHGDLAVAAGESIALVGGNVVNTGSLEAPGGEIGLVAVGGESTVRLAVPGSLLSLEVAEEALPTGSAFSPTDLPTLLTGGSIALPSSLTVQADGTVKLGAIEVEPEEVAITGSVSSVGDGVSGSAFADGGAIALIGSTVDIVNAVVDVSGENGGTVKVGHASDASTLLQETKAAWLTRQSEIRAEGVNGAGGDISIVADARARVQGTILAEGTTTGGTVTTDANSIDFFDLTLAVAGVDDGGQWLIEQSHIDIEDGNSSFNQIDPGLIEGVLDAGTDVAVTTGSGGSGDIALLTSIDQTGGGDASLTFAGRRFEDNGHDINLTSTGSLTFDLNVVNSESTLDASSIESAIAAIGNVGGRRVINLGAGNYDFSGPVSLTTDVEIAGAGASNTSLRAITSNQVLRVESGVTATLRDVTLTTSGLGVNDIGGGIRNNGNLTVESSHFVDNRAFQNGGAIDSFNGGSLAVFNSEFRDNRSASNGSGGAIHLGNASGTNQISNTLFENNESPNSGGAVNVSNARLIVNNGSHFVDNTATNGGALRTSGATYAELDAVTFEGNSATQQGGAIANNSNTGTLTIANATFDSNTAMSDGGAIAHNAAGQTLTLRDATFSENVSQEDGGAVFVNSGTTTVVEESQFISNRAEGAASRGGALAVINGGDITLTDTVVTSNESSAQGGGLFVDSDGTATVTGTLTTDSDGVATSATTRFVDNQAGRDGGGIAMLDESTLTVSGVLFRGNFSGDDGGGVSVTELSQATIDNANFENNTVAENGGGLYSNNILSTVPTGNKVVLTNSRFIENEAGQSGGGFYHGINGSAVVRDSLFHANEAMIDGGGVQVSEGSLTLANSQLLANQARFGAGLEVSAGGSVTVTDTALTDNVASLLGGGAQVDTGSTLEATRTTFEGNQSVSGGALFNLGTTELVNTTISGNRASDVGGAIRTNSAAATLTVRNSTVTNNQAGVEGGGIAEAGSQLARLQNTIVAANTSTIADDVSGSFTDDGNNLIGSSEGATGFTRSQFVGTATNPVNPQLAPLADNGGPTKTHLLLPTSVAVDAGSALNIPSVDQRQGVRLVGSAVDIGAVELSADQLLAISVGEAIQSQSESPDPTLPTTSFSELDTLLASRTEHALDDANSSIRRLERSFSQSFEDYWDLSAGVDTTFEDVQAILRRAQEEYKVNSAVIYAVFSPENPPEEDDSKVLSMEPTLSEDDLLNLSVVLPEGELVSYQLPVTRKEAVRQVRYFRTAVSDPEDARSYQPLAQQLYQWLLAPIEEDLAAQNVHNLMYALDSGLRTAPITAMRDYEGFALERYGISTVPSVGLMQADFPVSVRRATVAMGVSEFDTQAPLPAVPIELSVVDQFVPVSQTVLNENTTLDAIKSVQALEQPGVLHLATHASFDRRSPEDSYIHLWNEQLSMREFSQLDWKESDLEMLILSACSTALGSRNAELGFAGLAAASGVDATVGSLWDVSDVGTLALMSEFYAQIEETDMRFEALRRAQLALLKGETRIEGGNLMTGHGEVPLPADWNMPDSATLDHPFFWSAFTMVGNPW